MQSIKRLAAALLAAAALGATAGCYPMTLSAEGVGHPVSLTANIGVRAHAVRHFHHEFTTLYVVGLVPYAILGGPQATLSPADRIVTSILTNELAQGGDGIANLHVTRQFTLTCAGIAILPPVAIDVLANLAKVSSLGYVALVYDLGVAPMGWSVDGDIVSRGMGALPHRGVVALRHGRLDLGGVDVDRMLQRGARVSFMQQRAH